MRSMQIAEIAAAVRGVWRNHGYPAPPINAVSTDSRNITPGCLFVPLVGDRFDGHEYITDALNAGAAGCLYSHAPDFQRADKFYIHVQDTGIALGALASACREKFDIPFVQITGSVGKTTTKEMIASVLREKLRILKTEGNFNNQIGVPLTLLKLSPTDEAAVIETGMNHFGEIEYLGSLIRPDIAVITNVGDAHIEYLGSREGILKAKCEIFTHLREGGLVILNGDDPLLNQVAPPFRTIRCGYSPRCEVRITDFIDRSVDGIRCTEAQWDESAPYLVPQLKALIARYSKLGENAFYKYYLPVDNTLERALALLPGDKAAAFLAAAHLPGVDLHALFQIFQVFES